MKFLPVSTRLGHVTRSARSVDALFAAIRPAGRTLRRSGDRDPPATWEALAAADRERPRHAFFWARVSTTYVSAIADQMLYRASG
jgi:hypothetical protein